MKQNFGNKIKTARIKVGLTQSQLSEKLNVSPSAVGMYEQGRRVPDYDTLTKLCNILKISIYDFLPEDEFFSADTVFRYLMEHLRSQKDVYWNGKVISEDKRNSIVYVMNLILNDK